jgi:Uma2 family endonuclease
MAAEKTSALKSLEEWVHTMDKLSLEGYMRQHKREIPLEVFDYEVRVQGAMTSQRELVVRNAYNALVSYQHDFTHKSTGETFSRVPYIVLDKDGRVEQARLPDVSFILIERWQEYAAHKPDWQGNPLLIVPDVAVKVMSPADTEVSVIEWVNSCIHDGVQSVWYVDWKQKKADVYSATEHFTVGESEYDVITGIKAIPGFTYSVYSLINGV